MQICYALPCWAPGLQMLTEIPSYVDLVLVPDKDQDTDQVTGAAVLQIGFPGTEPHSETMDWEIREPRIVTPYS